MVGKCGIKEDCSGFIVGYSCINGTCGCLDANSDCPAGHLCAEKVCKLRGVFCESFEECLVSNKGRGCYEGKCGCRGAAECPRGWSCQQGVCVGKPSHFCGHSEE